MYEDDHLEAAYEERYEIEGDNFFDDNISLADICCGGNDCGQCPDCDGE